MPKRFSFAHRSPADLVRLLALAIGFCLLGRWGLSTATLHPSVSAFWPPTGLALATLLLYGRRLWPGVFVGAFVLHWSLGNHVLVSAGMASGDALEALVGVYAVERFCHGLKVFERVQDYLRFNLFAGLGSTMISATFGVLSLTLGHALSLGSVGQALNVPSLPLVWITWWLGDAGGDMIWAPFLLLWKLSPPVHVRRGQWMEAALLWIAVACSGVLAVQGWLPVPWKSYAFGFMRIPPLVWAAYRFGPRAAVTAVGFLSLVAVEAAVRGMHPATQTLSDSLLVLGLYIEVVGVTVMTLAIEARNRRHMERELVAARKGLEENVRQRTADLSQAVQRLKKEIAHRLETDRALQFSEKRFQRLVDSNIIGFMIVDLDGKIMEANETFLKWLGYTRDDLQDGRVGGLSMTPEEYRALDEWSMEHLKTNGYCPAFEKEYIRKDGSRIPVLVGVVLMDGPQPYSVCFVIDVTQRRLAQQALKKAYDDMEVRVEDRTRELSQANASLEREVKRRQEVEEALRHLSMADVLTGLHNRRGFMVLAEQHLTLARRNCRKFVLFFADLDRLKEINDVLGHAEGDRALIEAAELLRKTFRESDIIARIGGDEFAVVATDAVDGDETPYVERLRDQQDVMNQRADRKFQLSLSLGAAVFDPGMNGSVDDLMALADKDLYLHKSSGRKVVLPHKT